MRLNVLRFASPADALAAANHGDRVYFPGTKTWVAPSGGWLINKSLEIYGDGDGTPDSGPVLAPASANSPVFTIVPPVENVYLHDLHLRRSGTSGGSGVGILAQSTAANPTVISDLRLARVRVANFPSHGIQIEGYENLPTVSARMTRLTMHDCTVVGCGGVGLSLARADEVYMAGCGFDQNKRNGLLATDCEVALFQCRFDGNALLSTWNAANNPYEANLKLVVCRMVRVDAGRFVNVNAGNVKKAMALLGCAAGVIGPCHVAAASVTGTAGIVVTAHDPGGGGTVVPSGPVMILSGRFKNIATMISVEAGSRDCVVLPQYDESGNGSIVLPTGGNDGMFGAAHVARDASNAASGLIVPVLAADPTENVRQGMLAYNTTLNAMRVYKDGDWRSIQVE